MLYASLSLIDNALLQGFSFGVAVIGLAIAFRVLRYPDLTADGSFMMGAAAGAATLVNGYGWPVAFGVAAITGAAAGLVTGILHTLVGVNRLLSGILTTMVCYSLAFHVLGGRPNVGLLAVNTPYSSAAALDLRFQFGRTLLHPTELGLSIVVAALVIVMVYAILRSDFGLVLRATGSNPTLLTDLGKSTKLLTVLGLGLSNALVALAGLIVASRQAFVDVNMGTGLVITLIASLVLGEEMIRQWRRGEIGNGIKTRLLSPLVGSCAYFALYVGVVRLSLAGWLPIRVAPTDLRLVSALLLIGVVALRARQGASSEVLPM